MGALGRSVVVTGIGLVTPLGCTAMTSWSALLKPNTTSTAKFFTDPDDQTSSPPVVVMPVRRGDLPPPPSHLLGRDLPWFAHYALLSAAEAISDAGLPPRLDDASAELAGCSIGVGMANIAELVAAAEHLRGGKARRISPFLVPRVLTNTAAGLVAQVHNLRGPNTAPSTACAAGAHAVIEGLYAIQSGEAEIMVVGGAEAAIEAVGIAGFSRARALSTASVGRNGGTDDDGRVSFSSSSSSFSSGRTSPSGASRPFDVSRDGFVMGEGAGVLVLESASHARARGATRVYAEVAGAGRSCDAWHATTSDPDGRGARRAMLAALRSSGRAAAAVGYVSAHATGTRSGDLSERRAIAAVLSSSSSSSSSTALATAPKGAIGHLLGAAGAVEAAFTALTVCTGQVPPTRNLARVDDDGFCAAHGWGVAERYVPGTTAATAAAAVVERAVDVALCNSFGFGGTNACVVLAAPPPGFARRDVVAAALADDGVVGVGPSAV